jgi:hypothetical protein
MWRRAAGSGGMSQHSSATATMPPGEAKISEADRLLAAAGLRSVCERPAAPASLTRATWLLAA